MSDRETASIPHHLVESLVNLVRSRNPRPKDVVMNDWLGLS